MAVRVIRFLRGLLDVDPTDLAAGKQIQTRDSVLGEVGHPTVIHEYVDPPPAGITDHGALSGLGDNDHPQYQLAATAATDAEVAAAVAASEAGQVRDGDAAGGVLAGTYPNPSFAADMATQAELDAHLSDATDAHDAGAVSIADGAGWYAGDDVEEALAEAGVATANVDDKIDNHIADPTDAHDASAISFAPAGSIAATNVQAAIEEAVSEAVAGAPTGADYLVGTAQGGLSAEIVAGTSPGGELGGTWASPTVDATHSGSSHAGVQAAAEATAAAALASHLASDLVDGDAAGGVLGGTYPNPSFAADMATQAELDAHVNDSSDAHDASAISFVPAGTIAATTVQGAIEEVAAEAGSGGTGEALQKAIAQGAHGLAVGDVVRLSGTSYVKAQADAEGNAEVAGIVAAVADSGNFTLHYGGRITGLSGLTAGTVYFLDDDTAGLLTATPPADEGDVSKPVLIADTTTSGYFFNYRGIVLVDTGGGGGGGGAINYESRSSNTILGVADTAKTIDLTAAFTQTFEADETLGDGWWVILRNATDEGTVVVVLNPDGSETIDGLATVTMYSGESRLIVCNGAGANFNSVLLSGGMFRITATGNTDFIVPHGISWVEPELQGAGGGGGGGAGGGGGGGGRVYRRFAASALGNPGDAVVVAVGTGGTSAAGGDGVAGGNTTFGSTLLIAGGGGRGRSNGWRGGSGGGLMEQGVSGTSGASGSVRGGGQSHSNGGMGFAGGGTPDANSPGGASEWGGGSGGGLDLNLQPGGTSVFGGGGGGGRTTAGGNTGVYVHAGGGGGTAGSGAGDGGAGSDGTISRGGQGGGGAGSSGGGDGGAGGVPGGGGGGGGGLGGDIGGAGGRGEAIIRYG